MFLRYGMLMISVALPVSGYAAGSRFNIKSFSVQAPNTPYVGIGQMTREQRFTGNSPVTFIEYTLNNRPRRLWDDDGFATLFLYQRSLVSRAINEEDKEGGITEGSPLPKPVGPVIASIERLENYYKKLKDEDERAKTDPKIKQRYDKLIGRISGVAAYMKSTKFQQVKDIKESGLESLIADLESNHAYNVETEGDEMKNDSIGKLIGEGIPQNFGDPVYLRCYDEIEMSWITAAKNFSPKAQGGGGNGADTYMETKGVDTGN